METPPLGTAALTPTDRLGNGGTLDCEWTLLPPAQCTLNLTDVTTRLL